MFIREAVQEFGSSTIVAGIDVAKNIWGKYVCFSRDGKKATDYSPVEFARKMEDEGAGELLIQSIERMGRWKD